MSQVNSVTSYQGLTAVYPSSSGLIDIRTGLPQLGGGMNLGDYVDLTQAEAQQWSPNLNNGRFRFVQVDNGATAANVVRGKVGFLAPGHSIAAVQILTAGSGQTAGTYTATANSGVATIQYTISSSGTLTSVILTNPGSGYTSVPTFTISAGGTAGTVVAQMSVSPNVVTSYDAALTTNVRPVVFLNPTAVTSAQLSSGAYVFVQELGWAQVLGKSSLTASTPAVGDKIIATTAGVVDDPTQTTSLTYALENAIIGEAIDVPVAGTYFRIQLTSAPVQG